LVIEYLEVGVVEVDDATGVVVFDRLLASDMEQHLLFDHVLPLVLARQGALVLHGGVISREGVAVVLVGPTGAGKSTLTAYAGQKGWTVGGDDGALVHLSNPPTVEPTYSTIRLTPTSARLLGLDADAKPSVVGKIRLAPQRGSFRQAPVRLIAVAVIDPVAADVLADLTRLSGAAAHAALFGVTFHADLGSGRKLMVTLNQIADVLKTTFLARLDVPRGLAGLATAEALLRSLTIHHGAQVGRDDSSGTDTVVEP